MSGADVIVVGSGASATSAAYPLARAGLSVLMLDVGNEDRRYASFIPDLPFSELRRTDPEQHRYFLGDDFEGIPFGKVKVGAQLTPPRKFVPQDTDELTPLWTGTFCGLESLALGGLAGGWGAVAVQFDDHDVADYPIGYRDLAPHYESVSARVGISGARDDLLPFYGDCATLEPPLDLDSNAEVILARYEEHRERLNRDGFYLGRPRLAVLSRPRAGRQAQTYHDMDFYAGKDRSVFRPAYAVEELARFGTFTYSRPYLVERFRERSDGVVVEARSTLTGTAASFAARRLILAAGTLGTARIVLRSFGRYDTPVPLVSNPYTYVPCINTTMLCQESRDRRHSLTQLGIILAPPDGGPRLHVQVYSYRSLLLFKLAKEIPLTVPVALRVLRELVSSFVIFGIHHEDRPAPEKHCILRHAVDDGPDILEVNYRPDRKSERRQREREKALLRGCRRLGCWPLKTIRPGHGASIHYGGTLPMTEEERELTVTPSCRLRGTKGVYLADGSVLPYLPAKAPTLTLMANAERVGTVVLRELKA